MHDSCRDQKFYTNLLGNSVPIHCRQAGTLRR